MTWRWLLFSVVAILRVASANPGDPDRTLTAREVQKYFEPYVADVRACYLAHAKGRSVTGALRLELIIHHSGRVFRFGFAAPGVGKPHLNKLDTCLRKLVPTWRFPMRTGFTSAVLPFIFLKTNTPGAGPFESCWDARGCPPGPTTKGGSR